MALGQIGSSVLLSHRQRRPTSVPFNESLAGYQRALELDLASHSQVFGAGELRYVRETFESLPRAMNREATPMECTGVLDRETSGRLAEQHLDRLRGLNEPALPATSRAMPTGRGRVIGTSWAFRKLKNKRSSPRARNTKRRSTDPLAGG
jgi:hypothetical protein